MAGIKFDITGDNTSFIRTMNEVQASVRQTSAVLNNLGKYFNMDGAVQQIVSLTRAVEENEATLRRHKENISKLMDASIEARNAQDYASFNTIQSQIEAEVKSFEKLNAQTEEYKEALNELKIINDLMANAKAPMLFDSQDEFNRIEALKAKIEELQSQIANFDGSDADFTALKSELAGLNEELKKGETAAAKNAQSLGEAGTLAAAASTKYYELTNAIREQQAAVGLLTAQTNQAKAAYESIKFTGDAVDIDEARVKWQLYSDKLQSAKMELINMQTEQRNLQNTMRNLGDTVGSEGDKILGVFKQIAAAAGIGFGLSQAKDFMNQVVNMRAYFQDIESSMKVFLGSEEKGAEFTERLKDAAYYNMFEFKDLALASQQMIAYGHDIDTIIPRIQQLSDIAVGTQGNLMEMVDAYNRAKSTGVVDGHAVQSWAVKGVMIKDVLREIGEQATGTAITFEQLNKVIDHVTGEGGMFHNLQMNMMENISAEIGQFEDNFNAMLNEIGEKFQDKIVSGIKFGSEVVENYETIGRLLLDIVGAYGSYKAALLAVSAAHKLNAFWITAETTAEKINTAAKTGEIAAVTTMQVAWRTLTASISANTAAVLRNTAALMTNPYVVIGAAVAGLTFAVWKLVTAEDAETAARRRANEQMEEFKEQLEDRKNRINSYISVLHDQTASEAQQLEAWKNLKLEAASLTEGYTMAEFAAKSMDETQKELNRDSDRLRLENARQEVERWREEVEKATAIANQKGGGGLLEKLASIFHENNLKGALAGLEEAEEALKKWENTLEEATSKDTIGNLDVKHLFSGYKDAVKEVNETPIEPKVAEDSLKDAIAYAVGLQKELNSIDTDKVTAEVDGESVKEVDVLTNNLAENLQEIDISKTSVYVDKEELENARKAALSAIDELQKLDKEVADPDVKREKIEKAEEKLRSAISRMEELQNANAYPQVEISGIDKAIQKLKTAWGYLQKLMGMDEEKNTPQGSEKPTKKSTKKDFKAEIQKRIDAASSDTEVDEILTEVNSALKSAKYGSEDRKYYKGLLDQLNKKKKDNAYKSDKTLTKEANESAKQNAKALQEQWKHEEEMTKLQTDAARAREDASIAAIQNQAQRERAEREAQHQRTIQDLKRQEDDIYKAIYDQRKKQWELTHKNSPYENTTEGKDGWMGVKGTLTGEEQKYFDQRNAIIQANLRQENEVYQRYNLERIRSEVQSMRDYLKEYGTYEQQKLAIAQEYAEKIRQAEASGNQGEVLRLKAEQRKAEGSAKANELARGIDFSQLFEGVGNIVKSIAEETYKRVQEYKGTEEYKTSASESKKAIADLEARLIEKGGAGSASVFSTKTWDDITAAAQRYDSVLKGLEWKTQEHIAAIERQEKAQENYDKVMNDANSTLAERLAAEDRLKTANREAQETAEGKQGAQANVDQAGQELENAAAKGTKGLEDFNTILGQVTSGSLTGFTLAVGNIIKQLTGDGDAAKSVGELFGEAGKNIGGLIGAILSIIDALGDDPSGFIKDLLDKIASVIEAIISQIPEIVASVVKGAGNIVAGLGKGIINLFGLGGIFFGDNQPYEDALEKWQWVLDSWQDTIDYQRELMEKAYGVDAVKTTEEMRKTLERADTAVREIAKGWLTSGAGVFSSSNAYNVNEAIRWEYLSDELRKALGGDTVMNLFDLDWEQLEVLKRDNAQFWGTLHSEVQNYIDQIIEAGKAAEEAETMLMEKLTTTTEDNMFDSFLESLYNLADESDDVFDDIAGNWQKMVNKMLINNVVFDANMQQNLKDLYKRLSDAMNRRSLGGSNADFSAAIESIKSDYNDYVAQAQEKIEELRKAGLIMSEADVSAQDQSASVQAMERITTDQAEELIGRMNAGQMLWQQGNDQRALILQGLASMQEVVSGSGRSFSEMVTLMQTANSHLQSIYENNKKIYVEFGEKIDKMTREITNI